MDKILQTLLEKVADLHGVPEGAYNIRANGQMAGRNTTANIDIVTREDGKGIDVHIKPGTKKESVHIPVILSQTGLNETVCNDFFVGDDADVTIIAGCGIHNGGDMESEHDGIHRFFVGKNAKVKYVEKHYGDGDGKGERVMNPRTEITMDEGSYMEMESVQIKGVDSTKRDTVAHLAAGAKLVVQERLMTHGRQDAESRFDVCTGKIPVPTSFPGLWPGISPTSPSTPIFRAIACVPVIRNAMRSSWTKQRSALFRRSRQTIRMRP